MQTGFIVAIDLGTSKITGIVGRLNENNVISVLAQASIPSDGCIRRGLVYNIEKTGGIVRKLVSLLENSIQRKIGQVYVSLNGQSLHAQLYSETKQLSSTGIVTEAVIEQLRQSAEKYKPDLNRNYAIADVEYIIDDRPESNPVGVTCSQIEANFQLIVGRPSMMSNIEKSIEGKLGLSIADYVVGPLASAAITLSEEEKQLGCAFIDFGAGTTTLSIYKDGVLRRLVVIPFGGRTITKDICELNFVENDAEQYKIKFGKAKDNQDSSLFSSPFSSKPEIDMVELNKVIRMRLDEITANIQEQIRLSGYAEQLGAGVIITGGASQLKNLDLYLADKLQMAVRKASAKKTWINNSPDLANNPAMTQALGMLLMGDEDCEEIIIEDTDTDDDEGSENSKSIFGGGRFGQLKDKIQKDKERKQKQLEKQQEKQKKREEKEKKNQSSESGGFMGKIGNMFSDIFNEESDDE